MRLRSFCEGDFVNKADKGWSYFGSCEFIQSEPLLEESHVFADCKFLM